MPPTRLPRPWLAGLLNIFLPGLGLFYAGQQRRAWIGMAAFAVLAVVFTALQLIRPVPATVICMFAVTAVIVAGALFAIVMAYGAARQARAEGRARAPWTPVLLLLAASIAMSNVVRMLPSWVGHAFYNHSVPSGSMVPGLPIGTRLYTSQGPVAERGRIVFYHPRGADGATYMKRVVGLAGDRVRLTQGRLFVNGQAAAPSDPASEVLDGHRYPITPTPADLRSSDSEMPEQAVPAGTIFVLGDERNNSMDSRYPMHGPVPLERITAVGGVVYWDPIAGLVLRQLD